MVDNPTPAVEVNLLPCPFCGGDNIGSRGRAAEFLPWWEIYCCDCQAKQFANTEDKAHLAWNTRTPSRRGELEKLREALKRIAAYPPSSRITSDAHGDRETMIAIARAALSSTQGGAEG